MFGIGLPKSGTSTLGSAMETLGYRLGPRAYEPLKNNDWDWIEQAVDSADCFEDWPWPMIYRELDQRYPQARFILTERRDPDAWADSLRAHIANYGPNEAFSRQLLYENPGQINERAIQVYMEHNRDVRRHFEGRPGKLLTVCWESGDGWPQLCAFLDKPIPTEPFPHVNRRHSALKRFRKVVKRRLLGRK